MESRLRVKNCEELVSLKDFIDTVSDENFDHDMFPLCFENFSNKFCEMRKFTDEQKNSQAELTRKSHAVKKSQYQEFLQKILIPVFLDINEILPRIYISGLAGGVSEKALKRLGITHVVRILDGSYYKNRPIYTDIISSDIEAPDRSIYHVDLILKQGIYSSLASYYSGGTVLVHCHKGISRSASVVIGMIMKIKDMPLEEAYDLVKTKRNIINPYPEFLKALRFSSI